MNDEAYKEVEIALGEPVFIYFSEEVHKSRRNLLIVSSILLAYKYSGAHIEAFNPLGIQFKNGFDPSFIDWAFFVVIFYNLIHFIWLSADALLEWRVRITGTKLSHITAGKWSSEYADYPDNPRQSSLMTWWIDQAKSISHYSDTINDIKNSVSNFDNFAKDKNFADYPNINNVIRTCSELTVKLSHLETTLNKTQETIKSHRIPFSLERFEKWFRCFGWSQIARFIILEWGTPIVMACWALIMLIPWHSICEEVKIWLIPLLQY